MPYGLMWALSFLEARPAATVVGGGLSMLAGLVGLAALLASYRDAIPGRRRLRAGLAAAGSLLLVAVGGSLLLGSGGHSSDRQWQMSARQTRLLQRIAESQSEQAEFNKSLLAVMSKLESEQKSLLEITYDQARRINRMQIEQVTRAILADAKHKDPKKLGHYEYQVWSQNGEDGIIAEIFRRIGTTNRFVVEFGAANGLENNSALLIRQGWSGFWMDADTESVRTAKETFRAEVESGRLNILETFITAENIEDLFRGAKTPEEMDLLSIDIDHNDYHVWEKITHYRPRVVVIEYNAIVPPTMAWKAPYDPKAHSWAMFGNLGQNGASLKALEELGAKKGYSLVGCDLCGVNAFFVRNDLLGDHFAKPYTAESHYEPFRHMYFGGIYPAEKFPR